MDYRLIQLDNGIRVLLQQQVSSITHTCLIVNTGSRHEDAGKFGTAHFIEHLLFKQTERRNTKQILNRLESVGGDLNAYTTKEYMCIHASILQPYLKRALDLFEDIIFHSTFPVEEMEKEKGVILDEMASYLDSPEESILDDFEDLAFAGSGLGHNILGIEQDLLSITKDDIQQFISGNYVAEDIVIGIAGDYTLKEVEKLVHQIFQVSLPKTKKKVSDKITKIQPLHKKEFKPINQVHYALGAQAYGIYDDRKTPTLLLNNMLGGMGMSSILNLSIREKYGIAYTIESNYSIYNDTGLFSIYLGTDPEKVEKAIQLVYKELNKFKEKPISDAILQKAKNKFKGQIALAEENRLSVIIAETKNILDYNKVITLDEVILKIDTISPQDIYEVSNELFDEKSLTSLSFVPED